MKLRTQLLLTVGAGVAGLGVLGWMLWRPAQRGLPMPWGLLGVMAAVMVAAPVIGTLLHHRARQRGEGDVAASGSPRKRVLWAIAIALLWLTVSPLFFRGAGASWLAGVAGNLHMALMFVGLPLVFGCFSRQGDEPRCGACGYDLSGATADGEPRCPECGGDTRMNGGIVRGRKVVRRWMLAVGLTLLAAQAVWFVAAFRSPMRAFRWHVPLLPTGALIKEVIAAPRGFTMNEWAELGRRKLSPEQEARLAQALLDQRALRGYLSREAEAWLLKTSTQSTLRPDLVDRYYAEWMDLWFVAPDRARLGSAVSAGIGARYFGGGSAGRGLEARVLFAGFTVGDDTPRDRAAVSIEGVLMQSADMYFPVRNIDPGPPRALGEHSPRLSLVIEQPVPLRIRATMWIVIAPAGKPFQITWGTDGAPILPTGTVWSRRVDLEHTIEVDP